MWMMAAWQGLQNDSISAGNTRLLMIFVGIVALSMFVQAVVVISAALTARATQKRVLEIAEELRTRATPLIDKAIPIIDKAETLVEVTLPKIQTISNNLVETSEIVKAKAKEFEVTLTDVNVKTRAQVARVDGMVSTALTATSSLAEMVHKGIRTPLVEVSGLVNGFKAGIDVLFSTSKPKVKSVAMTKFEE
jgi:aspartyl/asparaginyl-tRNA synthetase